MNAEARTRGDGIQISVIPATKADRPVLKNLFQLYVYDFTNFKEWDVAENGRFEDDGLEDCWIEAYRYPFLIRTNGKLAGFTIVDGRSQLTGGCGIWDVADFFVLRRYQKRGVGEHVTRVPFDRFCGPWEVRVMAANLRAIAFWRTVINRYSDGQVEEVQWDDARWRGPVQIFDNSAGQVPS